MWLKREDLNHTGAHKINNTIGQALLALRMGKRRIIAETGAGQHGVATATVCARFGLECVVYMGAEDVSRQALNVYRMKLLGATVVPVESGTRTLKDATNEALRDWVTNVPTTHYIIGSVVGPDPYPAHGARFPGGHRPGGAGTDAGAHRQPASQRGGLRRRWLERHRRLCRRSSMTRRSSSSASRRRARGSSGHRHSATLTAGRPGVLHGSLSYLLQDDDGQVSPAHSVSAGLDYPGVGPEHSWLRDSGRVRYETADDAEALAAFQTVCRLEGIIPALETAHAFAWLLRQRGQTATGCLGARLSQRTRGQGRRARRVHPRGEGVTAGPNEMILPTSQVSELIQSLVKALRAFQMYLPNNPMYQRASQNVRAGFAPIWPVLDDLVLQVAETDFIWEEQVVYHQLTKTESLAWTLYKDGMRVLTLRKGVEEEEIVRFLEVVNRARFMQQDASDDLLTLLWEQEFNHIAYRFVEGFGDEVVPEAMGAMGGNTATSAAQVQQQVREEAPPKPGGIVDLEEFDSTLYFLDENEIAAVAEQLRQEYARDARASALAATLRHLRDGVGPGDPRRDHRRPRDAAAQPPQRRRVPRRCVGHARRSLAGAEGTAPFHRAARPAARLRGEAERARNRAPADGVARRRGRAGRATRTSPRCCANFTRRRSGPSSPGCRRSTMPTCASCWSRRPIASRRAPPPRC